MSNNRDIAENICKAVNPASDIKITMFANNGSGKIKFNIDATNKDGLISILNILNPEKSNTKDKNISYTNTHRKNVSFNTSYNTTPTSMDF